MPRIDRASRVIAAPLERVYTALVDPEALVAWLPPDGMSGRFERFDARPGGSYRMVLTYADASAAPEGHGGLRHRGRLVRRHRPGARVVQAVDFVSDDPAYAGTMTMTWEVTATDARDTRRHPGRRRPGRDRRGRSRRGPRFFADEPRRPPRVALPPVSGGRLGSLKAMP